MQKQKLAVDFTWEKWSAEESDLAALGKKTGSRLLFEIDLIHHFEQELLRLKNADAVWGPVHSSVGQEAVAAASIGPLKESDKVLGSHRAHHQFLSKALNFVLNEEWDPGSQDWPEEAQEVINRTFAEILGLAPGYCGGRGGSMHLRWKEAGFLGSNAIVGGGIPLAVGAAYAEQKLQSGNVVVCYFGDGAANQGAFHEALNLAGIWKLPIIFFVENNEFAVGTRNEDACAVKDISQRAASYGMDGYIVDGQDTTGIYRVMEHVSRNIRGGSRPAIVEAKCWRHYHHAGDVPGSSYGYRDKEEEARHIALDPRTRFPEALLEQKLLTKKEISAIDDAAKAAVEKALDFCVEGEDRTIIRENLWPDPASAGEGMRSDGKELEGLPYIDDDYTGPKNKARFSEAISFVTGRWMEKDSSVYEFGEEIANFGGGAYGATKGLPERFPQQIVNTPISEAGFTGLACGAAMNGLKTIIEIMFPDFALVAGDQLFNQIAKARHMYGGKTNLPLVARTRIATGAGYGGQHSMDPVAIFALFSGWRIIAPGNAFDYIGLFNTAMHSNDPVVFLEHHSLYTKTFEIPEGDLDYCIPFGKANVIRPGTDISVLVYSSMGERCKKIAEKLERQGVSAEIIDLRSLDLPSVDYDTIGMSLQKTGVLAIVEEAAGAQTIGPRIAEQVMVRFFDYLDAPVGCISSLNVPNSVSRRLEAAAIISDGEIEEKLTAMAKRAWR
ncbi:thiamine pyrophosphate-dependent enzyme [Marispirochaeta sp.]|jgi:2-oxoisovalerate dehydrogenase E1 component|uniref:alpha-ketoacid dehydrogenase subunit alpha/beta n=1 Tax=Marispirochaeta sp. TaxID=2038653 RepID=UPI0029C953ED|nr:thiamine pyrophosphate-dependent enzyme [Marispirochaeta sp.]